MDSPAQIKPQPPRRRRLLQFSLRGLLLLIAVCSVWLGIAFHRARQQARAVAAIKAAGGYVFYDYEGDKIPSAPSSVPGWLLNSVGVDFFHDVKTVFGFDAPITDELLAALAQLHELEDLMIGPQLSSNALVELRNLSKLRDLHLFRPTIDDEGLRQLAALPQLESLSIEGVPISDAGLEHIKAMPNLKVVELLNTNVTRNGAKALSDARPNCRVYLANVAALKPDEVIFHIDPHNSPVE